MATSSINFVAALGTGSGVDIKALAQNLVDAEKAPRQELIQKRIDKNEARTTAYKTVAYGIDQLADAVQALKLPTAFNSLKTQSTQPQAVTASVTDETTAAPGEFSVSVSQLARSQRTVGREFAATTTPLAAAGASAYKVYLSVGGNSEDEITVTTATPQGVMNAINAAKKGVTASLVNTAGTPPGYRLVLNGPEGAANTFTVRTTGLVDLGLAASPKTVSRSFASGSVDLTDDPNATSYKVFVAVGSGQEQEIDVTNSPTPQGVVAAVNAAGIPDVRASLVNTGGNPAAWRVVITGPGGDDQRLAIRTEGMVDLAFDDQSEAALALRTGSMDQVSQDARLKFNGLDIVRSSNTITDVVDGVTLALKGTLSEANTAAINLSRDTATVKDKIKAIVTAYNDLQAVFDAGFDPESKVEGLGGTLVGDISARRIRDQIRRIMMPEAPATGDGTELRGLRSLGVIIDTDKQMKFATLIDGNPATDTLLRIGDETKLDDLLKTRYADVATLFSTFNGLGKELPDQLLGNGVHVDSVLSPSSPKKLMQAGSLNAGERIKDDQKRLSELEDRMKGLLERYMKQFSVMDSLVGESKSIRTGVENSFKGMNYSRG